MGDFTISPILDAELFSTEYLDRVRKYTWEFALDLDPTDITNYKEIYIHAIEYLLGYQNSKDTLRVAVTEVEKYLQWLFRVNLKPPTIHDRLAIMDYFNFVKKPPIHWCSTANVRKFILVDGERKANSKWRPFKKLDNPRNVDSAVSKAFTYVKGFYDYLEDIDFIKANPCNKIKRAKLTANIGNPDFSMMVFTEDERELLFGVVDSMVIETPELKRDRFVFHAMITHYLRDSDLSEYNGIIPMMGDIRINNEDLWVINLHGKGNKKRSLALKGNVIKTLTEYREHHGLSSMPSPGEKTPLILKQGGKQPVGSTRQIRRLIIEIFRLAALEAEKKGWPEHQVSKFQNATPHWLRHSGISYDLNIRKRPIGYVKEDAGHSSLATTSLYLAGDDKERYWSGVYD
jgi:site-specific recombinase XerD